MRSTPLFLRCSLVAVSLVGSLALTSCRSAAPDFITSDRSYSAATATGLFDKVTSGDIAQKPTEDGPGLRQQALTDLRGEKGGNEAADFITDTFPATTGVPLYVERAKFDGKPAWLIVEAVGRPGGTLKDERLWVVTTEGDVLFSAMD